MGGQPASNAQIGASASHPDILERLDSTVVGIFLMGLCRDGFGFLGRDACFSWCPPFLRLCIAKRRMAASHSTSP